MTADRSAGRVLRNTLANGVGSFATIAISLALTPFIIDQVGLQAYGVFVLALSFTFFGGYAALSDLGVELATVRYVAEAESDADVEAMNRTVSTSMAFFTVVGLVATAIIVALSIPLTHLFGVPPSQRDAGAICFAFVGGQLVFELPARAMLAVLEGTQNYVLFQTVELTRALAQAALFVVVLVSNRGIGALGAAVAASSIAAFFMAWWLAHRTAPGLRLRPSLVSRTELRRLLRYGGALVVMRAIGTVYNQMDRVIVGIALGTRYVSIFEIANRIERGAAMVQTMAASALWPTTVAARREAGVLRSMYLRGTSYSVGIAIPVTIGGLILARPIIRSWVGPGLDPSIGPTRLLLGLLALISVHVVGSAMIVALGKTRSIILITSSAVAVNLVASIALVGPLGVEGVIIGSIIGQAIAWAPLLRLLLREFGVPLGEWLRTVALPVLPAAVVQALLTLPLLALVSDSQSFPLVGAALVASVAIGVVAFVLLGLRGGERARLVDTFRQAFRPRSPTPVQPEGPA